MQILGEPLARITLGTVLAGAIGFERDIRNRPAQLRTHILVGLAAATYMVVSLHFLDRSGAPSEPASHSDLARIAAAIVTGIGFLAGGAILRNGLSLQGLTTAAGLWMVGAIGMSSGAGLYEIAVFTTALGLLVLGALRRFEERVGGGKSMRLLVAVAPSAGAREIEARLARLGVAHERTGIRSEVDAGTVELDYDVRLPGRVDAPELLAALGDVGGLRFARCESAK